jgi:hypothetical protein
MKIRLVHVGLVLSLVLMFALWGSAQLRQASVTQAVASPDPAVAPQAQPDPAMASTPEARAYQSRLAFERHARSFLRDAPGMDDRTRIQRAQALSREIDRREQARELSADEAVMLRIGLIHAAVKDDRQRVRQAQEVVDRYRKQTAERQAAFLAQQRRDAQFQEYKAAEARIVSEVLAMSSYPNGMSRDDYLRQRLQQAREAIYANATKAPAPGG